MGVRSRPAARRAARSRDEAIAVLRRASATIRQHGALTIVLAAIQTDLAIDVGAPADDATKPSTNFAPWSSEHLEHGSRVFVGLCPPRPSSSSSSRGERPDDRTEARRLVDQWQAQRPGIPALDLWWLRSRALLAKADGDPDGYADLCQAIPRAVRRARTPVDGSARHTGWRAGETVATILAYTSPALGHLLPICALLAELHRRGHTVALRTLSTGVGIADDRSASTRPRSTRASRRSRRTTGRPPIPLPRCRWGSASFARRAVHEVTDLADAVSEVRPGRTTRRRELLGRPVGSRGRRRSLGVLLAVHPTPALGGGAAVRARPTPTTRSIGHGA